MVERVGGRLVEAARDWDADSAIRRGCEAVTTTRIRIMSDYDCHPVWVYEDGVLQDNVPPDRIGVSPDLARRLEQWAARYDAILDRADPRRTAWPSAAEERDFGATGRLLAQAVADELDEPVRYGSDGGDVVLQPLRAQWPEGG